MLLQLLFRKMIFKEVETLQHVRLLDIRAAKNTVPAPLLIDRPLIRWKITHPDHFFIQKAVLLQEHFLLF